MSNNSKPETNIVENKKILQCTAREPTQQGSYGTIIIGILLSFTIVTLLAILFFILMQDSNISHDIPPAIFFQSINNSMTTNLGATTDGLVGDSNNGIGLVDSLTCFSNATSQWSPTNNSCICTSPFYGPSCHLEGYNLNYRAIGNPSPDNIIIPPTRIINDIDRLSFDFTGNSHPQTKCTVMCDNMEDCQGVFWNSPSPPQMGTTEPQGTCTLLLGDIFVREGQNIPYDSSKIPSLYLKNLGTPKFTDRAFVYTGNLLTRYWLEDSRFISNEYKQLTMFKNTIYQLGFKPFSLVNDGNLIGIFSIKSFTLTMVPQLINLSGILIDTGKTINTNIFNNPLNNINNINQNSFNNNNLSNSNTNNQLNEDEYYIYCPGNDFKIPTSWNPDNIYGIFTDYVSINP